MQDPKKRERFFVLMTFAPLAVNICIIIGFVVLVLKLLWVL